MPWAVRDVVLSPAPTAVGLALGVGGARYAFENLKRFTGRLAPLAMLDPVLASMRARLGSAAGDGTCRTSWGSIRCTRTAALAQVSAENISYFL